MLWFIFVISTTLLVMFVVFRLHEMQHAPHPISGFRRKLDRVTMRATKRLQKGVTTVIRYAHSDVLLKGLHVVTYVALVIIRFIERKLVHTVHVLRVFRKERLPRQTTHKLASFEEPDIPSEEKI